MPNFMGHSFQNVNDWLEGKCTLRYGKEHTALWRIMCDATTIKENHLMFDTNLSLGEDTTFINTYFLYESSIGYLDECFYHLAQRESGANLTSVNHAEKRIVDKTKLIYARLEIDKLAKNIYDIDTHKYWEGTLVFSGIEMALRMSKNKSMSISDNLKMYKDFMSQKAITDAFSRFTPSCSFKALPFWIVKYFSPVALFFVCMFFPDKIVSKMSR